jgi:hypothetical protein
VAVARSATSAASGVTLPATAPREELAATVEEEVSVEAVVATEEDVAAARVRVATAEPARRHATPAVALVT